jgi:hypothetical protein
MPSTKAAGGGIFSGVFQQGHQGTSQGQEDFELSWYLFFQQLRLLIVTVQTAMLLSKLIVLIAVFKSYWAVFRMAAQ